MAEQKLNHAKKRVICLPLKFLERLPDFSERIHQTFLHFIPADRRTAYRLR